MEILWLASFRESSVVDLGLSGLMGQRYCEVCQHVGMGIIPSCLTSAPELVQCPPCTANGETLALQAPLHLLPSLGGVNYHLQVSVPLVSLLQETQ